MKYFLIYPFGGTAINPQHYQILTNEHIFPHHVIGKQFVSIFVPMKKILSVIKNKYLLTIIGLLVWVVFFDKNDLRTQIELRQQVKQLEKERNYFAQEISVITADIKELTTNPNTLEKFAREKYLMKRNNEDIFVIVEDKKN